MVAKGQPVGTIFVELDLDDSRYLKGQQALLKSATSTSLNIEQNFKNLGVKSSAEMDLMRAKINNSFEMIANSSRATANDIIRAEEAKNAKLMALNEQQFGRQMSSIEKLKANWIAASVAITAAWMLINKAVEYMDQGAKAMQVESSFKIMADEAGVSSERLIASMKAATKETIDDSDLMAKATKLMLQGYNPEQIERFSKVVITASQYAGVTAAEAYDQLGDSIANKMPKAMIRIGAVTRDQMKVVQKAVAEGADEMALYELAMANLELKTLKLQGTQNEAALSLQKFHTQVNETKEAIGKGLIWVCQKLYAVFQGVAAGALYITAGLLKMSAAVAWLQSKMPDNIGKEGALEYETATNAAQAAFDAANDLSKKAADNAMGTADVGKKATKEEIAAGQAKIDAQMKGLKAIVDAAKHSKDILKSVADANKHAYDAAIEAADHAAKMQALAGKNELSYSLDTITAKEAALKKWYADQAAGINKYEKDQVSRQEKLKALDADYNKELLKYEDQKKELAATTANYIRDTNESLYQQINKYSKESVDAQIAEINRRAEAEKVPGANLALIAKAQQDAIQKIYRDTSDAIASSFISGFDEIANSMSTTYEDAKYFAEESLKYQLERFQNTKDEMLKLGWTVEEWTAWYNAKAFEAQLKKQVLLIRKHFDDLIGVATLAADETSRAWLAGLEKLEGYSNDISVGVEAAFLRIQMNALTWAQVADETVTEFAKEAQSTLSTVFFDATKGELKSFMEYWNAFFDSLSKKFLDMCSQMVIDWIMAQAKMKMTASGGGGIGGFLESAIGWIGGLFSGGSSGTVAKLGTPGPGQAIAAKGMAIDRGNVIPFARGTIVDRPTFFPMARGAGLMGEAGPEGILPLKRTKSGKLGVASEGGASNVINIVNVASPDLLDSYLATARGQNAVMNVISSKSGTVKRVLRK
jgi:hypothetical protein